MGPQSAGLIITFGFGSGGAVPPSPPQTIQAGAGRAGRRTRRRTIVLRINGERREVEELEQVLDVLKAVKKDVASTAREAAEQIVRTGKRIGEARRDQQHAIEVVEAPFSMRDMIETRLREVERAFWRRVEIEIRAIQEDDDDVMILI